MAITRYSAQWGQDEYTVEADWAEASCPIKGDLVGKQVADYHHDGWAALREALQLAARFEGLNKEETERLVEEAMEQAEESIVNG